MQKVKRIFNYKITLMASDNGGVIVKIGCATAVFDGKDTLLDGLENYLSDPDHWEKEYNNLPGTGTITEATEDTAPERPRAEVERTDPA